MVLTNTLWVLRGFTQFYMVLAWVFTCFGGTSPESSTSIAPRRRCARHPRRLPDLAKSLGKRARFTCLDVPRSIRFWCPVDVPNIIMGKAIVFLYGFLHMFNIYWLAWHPDHTFGSSSYGQPPALPSACGRRVTPGCHLQKWVVSCMENPSLMVL